MDRRGSEKESKVDFHAPRARKAHICSERNGGSGRSRHRERVLLV